MDRARKSVMQNRMIRKQRMQLRGEWPRAGVNNSQKCCTKSKKCDSKLFKEEKEIKTDR